MKLNHTITIPFIVVVMLIAGTVWAQSGAGYIVIRSTVAGGSATSSGGGYTLRGTTGQPEANEILTGGGLNMTGGFWALPAPIIISPTSGAPARNYFTVHTLPLSWNGLSWAIGYQVQIATDKLFTNIIWNDAALSANTLTVTTPYLANSVYYWRVRAKIDAVKWSNWSAVDTFTVNSP